MDSLEDIVAELNKLLRQEEENIFELVCVQNRILQLSYELMNDPPKLGALRQLGPEKFHQFIEDILKKSRNIGQKIATTAIYEPKTGLLNVNSFNTLFNAHFLSCAKGECNDLVYAIFDIDFFKRINENYGYSLADRALIQVVNIILQNIRGLATQTPFDQALQLLEGYAQATYNLQRYIENKSKIIEKYKFSFVSVGGIFSLSNELILYEIVKTLINPSESYETFTQRLPVASTEAFVFDFATLLRYEEAGRFGGEEIVVVFPDTTIQRGYEKCEIIRKEIEGYFTTFPINDDNDNGYVSVSCGLQSYQKGLYFKTILDKYRKTGDTSIKGDLFVEANIALSVAKYSGRNKVFTFNGSLVRLDEESEKSNGYECLERLKIEKKDIHFILTKIKNH